MPEPGTSQQTSIEAVSPQIETTQVQSGILQEAAKTPETKEQKTGIMGRLQSFVESIKEDIKWLGFNWEDEVKFLSDVHAIELRLLWIF